MGWLGNILKGGLGVVGGALGGPLGAMAGGALGGLIGGKKKPAAAPGMPIGSLPGTGLNDQFTQAIGDERNRRNTLNTGLDKSLTDTDSAIASEEGMHATQNNAFNPTTGSYQPTEQQGFDPSSLTNLDPTATRGVDLSGVKNFKSTNLEGFDPSTLDKFAGEQGDDSSRYLHGGHSANEGFTPEGFDAGAAVNEYARGGLDDAKTSIKDQLYELQGKNAASGRLDTGYLDRDRGEVIGRVGRGFANALTDKAVQAAGITGSYRANADNARERAGESVDTFRTSANLASGRGADRQLSALTDAAKLRFDRAGGIDKNALEAQTTGADLSLKQGMGIDEQRRLAMTSGKGLELDRAKGIDTSRLDAMGQADRLNLDKSQFGDTFDQKASQFGVSSRLDASRLRGDLAEGSSNRYLDALTGGLDREQADKNAKAQRKSGLLGGIIGAVGSIGKAVLPSLLKKPVPSAGG